MGVGGMERQGSKLRDEVDVSQEDVRVHVRDMPCHHTFALHRRFAFTTAPCAVCATSVGRFERVCLKCTTCGNKVHFRCGPPGVAAAIARAGGSGCG